MELQARVPLKFVAQYVSDRLSDAWNFEDEVCDGFYDWIMGSGCFEGDPLFYIDNCYRECEYLEFEKIKELKGIEFDKEDYTKLSEILEKEVLFTTENFVVFSW